MPRSVSDMQVDNGLGRGWLKYAGNMTAVGAIIAIVLFQTWRAEVRFDVMLESHRRETDVFQSEMKSQREHDLDRTRRISEKLAAIEQSNRDNGRLLADILTELKRQKVAGHSFWGWPTVEE